MNKMAPKEMYQIPGWESIMMKNLKGFYRPKVGETGRLTIIYAVSALLTVHLSHESFLWLP